MKYCYLNGKIVEIKKARISPNDIGLARGYGVYDGIMLYGGKPFELPAHYKRFTNSAKLLGLKVPYTLEDLEKSIAELYKKNKPKNPVIKLLLTGGETVASINFDKTKPTVIILMEEIPLPDEETFEKGVKIMTHEFLRYLPTAKTTNYIEAVRLQEKKNKVGAVEIVYTHNNNVLEASTSNLFIAKDHILITAPTNILGGITRKVTLQLAKKYKKQLGLQKIEERHYTVAEMLAADEVFLTSSFKEVLPVVNVDGKKVGNQSHFGKPGNVSKELLKLFREYVKQK
jgi:branched-chain amino acid aminotransferase